MNRPPVPALSAVVRRAGRRYARGATLLEAVAFLGVAAIVMTGAIGLMHNSFRSATSERFVEESNALATNVRALYASPGSGGYAALSMTDLYNSHAFPGTLQAQGAGGAVTVTNAWGGAVTVTLGANNIPVLTYANVPKEACIDALLAGGNWVSVAVNSVAQSTSGETAAQAVAACSGASNTMAWGFS